MERINEQTVLIQEHNIESAWLKRTVKLDIYVPTTIENWISLPILLINDGQDMAKMSFATILEDLYKNDVIEPILCVAIHAGKDRKMEYGVVGHPDYLERGALAGDYFQFLEKEVFPFLQEEIGVSQLPKMAYAGFSLGGLSALDNVWNHPEYFHSVGVFSGSLWWRSVDQTEEEYDDDKHRIIHQVIRQGEYKAGMRFFFQCGNQDETHDRNNNGIIDSIDDTMDLIKELDKKGYEAKDVFYMELKDGKHDVPTWGRAFPYFLKWIFGKRNV